MIITPIHTRRLTPPTDDLLAVMRESILEIPEQSILIISSKVVSIDEGRCVPAHTVQKSDLVRHEAELFLKKDNGFFVTIKNGMLVISSGIDESNGNGFFILHPEHPQKSARRLWEWVRTTYGVRDLAVVIVDSCSLPLRRGSVGLSIDTCGFKPLRDYRKKADLFGRLFKVSQLNVDDSLASAGVLAMGEGAEATPIALVTDIAGIEFIDYEYVPEKKIDSLHVPMEDDKYEFLKKFPWQRGGGGALV